MSTTPTNPSPKGGRRPRIFGLLAPMRRRLIVLAVVLLIVAGVVIASTEPFAGSRGSNSGVSDNSYPTSVATVTEEAISPQTQVSATLGYAGSFTVSIPAGVAPTAVTADQQSLQNAEEKVAADERALSNAEAVAAPANATTLLADKMTVQSDTTTLAKARAQLASDQSLGCPLASSATVTSSSSSPSGAGSAAGAASSSDAGGAGRLAGSSPLVETPAVDEGSMRKGALNTDLTESGSAALPSVTTGSASVTGVTSATLSGTVDPNGSDTSYAFEYGTTASFGKTTASQSAGDASGQVAASTNISGLTPGTTYDFTLVATSAAGTVTGVTQTFETGQSSCVAQALVVSQDSETLVSAVDTLKVDQLQSGSSVATAQQGLASDEQALGAAQQALSSDESQQANPGTTFTSLPSVGTVLHRGSPVYSLDGHPVPLFYGSVIPDRALYLGWSDGPDVSELQANLIALGYGNGITASPHFSAATEMAGRHRRRSGAPRGIRPPLRRPRSFRLRWRPSPPAGRPPSRA